MNLVSQYVLRVGAYIIFSLLLEEITPGGSSKKMMKLVIGLVFMYILIQPVVDWIQLDIPLSQLTTAELRWDETENHQAVDYEEQAWSMVGKGYEQALLKQGLPGELKDEYRIENITVDDVVEVTLAREEQIGSLTDRSLQFGKIGSSREEKEKVLSSLSEYWGISVDQLEMKLR